VIYERIKLVLSCQTQHCNFRAAKWPRSFPIPRMRRRDAGAKKSRDRFLASRSDLIKDAVRTARQTDPGGGEEGSMKGETTRGVPEGRNRPLHSRDAQSRPTICGFHVFSTLLRSPRLCYVTGGLVPLWWPERHSRPPRPNIIVIYRALSRIPHNKGRLDYLLPRLKLPLPLPFFPARALFPSEDCVRRNETLSLTKMLAIRQSDFTLARVKILERDWIFGSIF